MVKTWQVILATVAIFVAGLVAGGATAVGVFHWVVHHRMMNGGPLGPFGPRMGGFQGQQFVPQLMRSLAKQLDLSEEQRARIVPIVKRTASQLGRDRREVQLASALAIEKMQDEIADILTPDQRTKFDELVKVQRARLQQFKQGAPLQPAQEPRPPSPPASK